MKGASPYQAGFFPNAAECIPPLRFSTGGETTRYEKWERPTNWEEGMKNLYLGRTCTKRNNKVRINSNRPTLSGWVQMLDEFY